MLIQAPIRVMDKFGSGAYGASRGRRTHKGVDVACYQGSKIPAIKSGRVTKIGYPYRLDDKKRGHLRYVEITVDDEKHRYFYVSSFVKVGDLVEAGQVIGKAQGLLEIYPGITDHIHFEIKLADGSYKDPTDLVNGAEG